jgi:glycosyltransferase involved in cell wall biosynthesis
MTGVDRAASELTRAMRDLLDELGRPCSALEVALPAKTGGPVTTLDTLGNVERYLTCRLGAQRGLFGGHVWEQISLARYRPEAWLLNLCNTGPVLRRRQLVVMYDAQFITQPSSYSLVFRAWYRVLLTLVGRTARLVFTSSEVSRRDLEAYGVVPRGKTRVVQLGVDHMARVTAEPALLNRLGLAPHSYVLAIGSLAPHKNLSRLVQAFAAAELDDVQLVIAGGGNLIVFRDAGLPQVKNVIYAGRVSDPELRALYENALAFACPSLSEGFGLPPLEAMFCGCPVVATMGGSVPEVCGEAALYADPLDVPAWTAALRRIVSNPALRNDMARVARERAALFTWKGAARHLLRDLAEAADDAQLLALLGV